MSFPSVNPTTTKSWRALQQHFEKVQSTHMKDLFLKDPQRAATFSIEWEDIFVDYSKHRITSETLELLIDLANEVHLEDAINAYFSGERISQVENRAVLHTALRSERSKIVVDGHNVVPEIREVKSQIKAFSEAIISGEKKGATGKSFTDVVNIGVGGSDLGPEMVIHALEYYKNHLNVHFVNNVDGDHVHETIKKLNPETTLFIVVSKSFTTQETLTNALTLKTWFLSHGFNTNAISKHFVAVSTNSRAVQEFGIDISNMFIMWDWVGGRFSLWSAVGLSISLAIGYSNFEALLKGASHMDRHFKNTEFRHNIPIVLALLSIWYNNFFNAESEAVIPYSQYLRKLPRYLQQAVMESNGKSIDRNGEVITYQTGNIIWGETGTNSQHAFFQLIHQGSKLVPVDFIGFTECLHGDRNHHHKLMSNYIAQTEALLNGKTYTVAVNDLRLKNYSEAVINKIVPYTVFEGNKPTTSILIEKLTPNSLGKLIALYEHKIFVQGVIWNIFSFDQFGVELGKKLCRTILKDINTSSFASRDSSTNNLLKRVFT